MYALAWREGRRDEAGTVWIRLDETGRGELREVEGFAGRWIEPICGGRLEGWVESLHPPAEAGQVPVQERARARVERQLHLPFSVRSSPSDTPIWTEAVCRLAGSSATAASLAR